MRRWREARRRWRHSLKWRLVTLFLLLALATTAVFLFGMQRVLQGGWQGYAKPLVADYVDKLAAEIGSPPDEARAKAIVARLPVSIRIDGPQVQYDSHPEYHVPRRWNHSDGERQIGAEGWGLTRTTADGHRIRFGLAGPPPDARPRNVGWATLAALLLMLAAAYATVWQLLRPLQAINAGVQAFGRGQFTPPIAVQRRDELGELTERINAMAASLHGMLDAKRALLLALSHELRSPLTRARVNAELLDDTPERSALLRDLGEMRDLIATLLESERLAQGHSALQAEPTDLAALARAAAAAAVAEGQALTLDIDDTLGPVSVDPTRVRLLLRNLLANARRHAGGAAAAAELFLRRESGPGGEQLALGLRDHGPGVAAEQVSRLAQAFYRPDAARTRGSGGVGLGLHLCRLVAQAHGCELRIRLAQPGLEVAMVWA